METKVSEKIDEIEVDESEFAEIMTENTELITEKISEIMPEKRTRGQRGPDKVPRRLNPDSIRNLKTISRQEGDV